MSDAECREPAIFCILHPAFVIQGAYFSTLSGGSWQPPIAAA
jgi:hypothetical protein